VPGQRALKPLVLYFLRLGFLGFGGPVALVGQMERELVGERGWLTGSLCRGYRQHPRCMRTARQSGDRDWMTVLIGTISRGANGRIYRPSVEDFTA